MNKPGKNEELRLMKPFVPPLQELIPYLERILASRLLTNGGPVHAELEEALRDYLKAEYVCLFSSGTTALIMALKALNLKGEIITTPFTSIATAQAIYWNNLEPVFVDINETDFNINTDKIEKAITPKTKAILPVHIFGNPCDLQSIEKLARRYDLKVIYDAAHCFGVEAVGVPVCNFGDMSVLSFHATKVFNTIEGGAIICHDKATKKHIEALKNTGILPGDRLAGFGFNAKMNEVQAAFGLVQLNYIDGVINSRKTATLKYRDLLKNIKGIKIPKEKDDVKYNYTYFPVVINPDEFGIARDDILRHLTNKKIFAKKYFHPLVTDYPEFGNYRKDNVATARKIADNILCLPLFHDISENEISGVVNEIKYLHKVSS